MSVVAFLAVSGFISIAVFQPRLALRRHSAGAIQGWSETTCLLSYAKLKLLRGTDERLRVTRVRRNIMLASYGWADPTE